MHIPRLFNAVFGQICEVKPILFDSPLLKEWLLYTRYKEEIPKILLVVYYFILIIHLLGIISCIILHFTDKNYLITGRIIVIFFVFFDEILRLTIQILFWGKQDFAYDRWINKRRGQKKV